MERLKERLAEAWQALRTLQAVLKEPKTEIVRDAAIQRFEYTSESVWKAAQRYLKIMEKHELAFPKAVIRACREAGILLDEEARDALKMVDDRNMTVHLYKATLAEEIYARLPNHARVMEAWLKALQEGIRTPLE